MTSSRALRAGVATGLLGGLALAGCGLAAHMSATAAKAPPQAHVSSHTSGSTAPAHSGGASSSTSGSGGSSVTTTSSHSGPPACATSDLRVTAGSAEAAAGSVGQVIDFQNTSHSSCSLYGFPGIAFTSGRAPGDQIGVPASRYTYLPATLVALAPGQTAHTLLTITDALNAPTSRCHPVKSAYLQVYPPNQRQQVYLRYVAEACSSHMGMLGVTVVQRGRDRIGD